MKTVLIILTASALPIACVAGVVYLIAHDKTGWGWLVFLAVISAGASIKTKD